MRETRFRYRAVDNKGRVVKGEMNALHEAALAAALADQRLELIDAEALKPDRGTVSGRLARRELIDLFYYLEILVRAGVPLIDALKDLAGTADSARLRLVAAGMAESIATGATLGDAMAAQPAAAQGSLPDLIRAGEASGTLEDVLGEIVAALKWQDEIAAATKKALLYPAFAGTVVLGAVVFLMNFVVPQLVVFIKSMGGELPAHTRALIWTSEFFAAWWWLILPAPFALALAAHLGAKVSRPFRKRLHALTLRLPVFGPVILKIQLAKAVNLLAMMYRSGIPLLDALDRVAGAAGNLVIADAIMDMRDDVASGVPVSLAAARCQVFPPLVVRMFRIGENTGTLDEALGNVKYFYQRDINDAVGRLQSMIEPILTVVLGLILGWIMLAVIGPIYDTIAKLKL